MERDLRVDFCRGFALIIILINHIEYVTSNRLALYFTHAPFGYSDMAQAFILLSGYSYGIVYQKQMIRNGGLAVIAKSFLRAFRVYTYHAVVSMLLLIFFLSPYVGYDNNPFLEYGMVEFVGQPVLYIVEILSLAKLPAYLGILPLYVILLILAPLQLILYNRNKTLAILLSVGLYLYSQVYHLDVLYGFGNIYIPFSQHHFHPFAWQFLFFIAMLFGAKKVSNDRVEFGWIWKSSALLFVLGSILHFKIIKPLLNRGYVDFDTLWLTVPYDKIFLTPALIIHIFCLWLLFVVVSPESAAYKKSRLAKPFILIGRNAIDVFALGLILTFLTGYIFRELDGGIALLVTLEVCAIALSLLLAYGLEKVGGRAGTTGKGDGKSVI